METINSLEENKLPQGLNTLTILTFIGCAIAYILGIFGFINADKSVTDLEKNMNNPDLPAFAKNMMTPEALDNARIMATNKLPILIMGLIATTLCLFGAIQMRQRKLNGYYLWLTGEILPFITAIIFINAAATYKGYAIIGIVFALVFIILYTMQRKYLTSK